MTSADRVTSADWNAVVREGLAANDAPPPWWSHWGPAAIAALISMPVALVLQAVFSLPLAVELAAGAVAAVIITLTIHELTRLWRRTRRM